MGRHSGGLLGPAQGCAAALQCRTCLPWLAYCTLTWLCLAPPHLPLQRLLDPLVTPDTLPVHPIRKLQVRLG